ncbi:MAG: hypothetical protein AAGI17_00070 [Planctomycetota bacterium]
MSSKHQTFLSSTRLAAAATAVLAAGVAVAQQSDNVRPPTPSDDPSGAGLMGLVVFVLLAGAVIGAMTIPTKRGHQD